MSTIADYLDRTIDYFAFRGVVGVGPLQLQQSFAGTSGAGEICTGIQKLVQRFVLELLTEKGTIPYDTDRGCTFLTDAVAGRLQTELDVIQTFNLALIDIIRNLQGEEAETDPTDERFSSARLLGMTLLPGYLSLRVQVTSQAGTSRVFILPLPVVP